MFCERGLLNLVRECQAVLLYQPREQKSVSTQTDNSLIFKSAAKEELYRLGFTAIVHWSDGDALVREAYGIPSKITFDKDWGIDFLAIYEQEKYLIQTFYSPETSFRGDIKHDDISSFLEICSQFRADIFPLVISNLSLGRDIADLGVMDFVQLSLDESSSRNRIEVLREYTRRDKNKQETLVKGVLPLGYAQFNQRRALRGCCLRSPPLKGPRVVPSSDEEYQRVYRETMAYKQLGLLSDEDIDDIETIRGWKWKHVPLSQDELDMTYVVVPCL